MEFALLAAFLSCRVGHSKARAVARAGGGGVRPWPHPGQGTGSGGGRPCLERDGRPCPSGDLDSAEARTGLLRWPGEGCQLHPVEPVPAVGPALLLARRILRVLVGRQTPSIPCRLCRQSKGP